MMDELDSFSKHQEALFTPENKQLLRTRVKSFFPCALIGGWLHTVASRNSPRTSPVPAFPSQVLITVPGIVQGEM